MLLNALLPLLIVLSFLVSPVRADDFAPLKLELYDPTVLLIGPDDERVPDTKNDILDIYYSICVENSASPYLTDYVQAQCGCTAAEMGTFMSEKDLRRMFKKTDSGNVEYARMLLLAYVPCLQKTILNYTYDTCVYDGQESRKTKTDLQFCHCLGADMSQYVGERPELLIPGFTRHDSFKKSESVADVMGYVLQNRNYQRRYRHHAKICAQDYPPSIRKK